MESEEIAAQESKPTAAHCGTGHTHKDDWQGSDMIGWA